MSASTRRLQPSLVSKASRMPTTDSMAAVASHSPKRYQVGWPPFGVPPCSYSRPQSAWPIWSTPGIVAIGPVPPKAVTWQEPMPGLMALTCS